MGIIASVTQSFCGSCDRVRLTSDGGFRTCLFATGEVDLRALLRGGASDDALAGAVIDLMSDPDERHRLRDLGLRRARSFDWSVVAERIMAVYETVIEGADSAPVEPALRAGLLGRLRWPLRGEA